MPSAKNRFQILSLRPKKHVLLKSSFFDAPKVDKLFIKFQSFNNFLRYIVRWTGKIIGPIIQSSNIPPPKKSQFINKYTHFSLSDLLYPPSKFISPVHHVPSYYMLCRLYSLQVGNRYGFKGKYTYIYTIFILIINTFII